MESGRWEEARYNPIRISYENTMTKLKLFNFIDNQDNTL